MIAILNRELLLRYLDRTFVKGIGIEVGVQKGDFSHAILNNWSGCKELYLMDCWKSQDENIYNDKANVSDDQQQKLYEFVKNRFIKSKKVKIVQAFSPQGADLFPDDHFSFIYLDADHSYEAVKKDLEAWYPKLKSGGVFAGHDYMMDGIWKGQYGIVGDFGVTKAVKEFAEEQNLRINHTMEPICKSWFTMHE